VPGHKTRERHPVRWKEVRWEFADGNLIPIVDLNVLLQGAIESYQAIVEANRPDQILGALNQGLVICFELVTHSGPLLARDFLPQTMEAMLDAAPTSQHCGMCQRCFEL